MSRKIAWVSDMRPKMGIHDGKKGDGIIHVLFVGFLMNGGGEVAYKLS